MLGHTRSRVLVAMLCLGTKTHESFFPWMKSEPAGTNRVYPLRPVNATGCRVTAAREHGALERVGSTPTSPTQFRRIRLYPIFGERVQTCSASLCPWPNGYGARFPTWIVWVRLPQGTFGDRLTVDRQPLKLSAKVRLLLPELSSSCQGITPSWSSSECSPPCHGGGRGFKSHRGCFSARCANR
jgi:hypothetical protein